MYTIFGLLIAFAVFLAIKITFMVLAGDKEPPTGARPPPEEKKPYTYADYLRDLHDKEMSISDILDKCGGVIPTPPVPEPEAPKPPELSDAVKSKMEIFERMAGGHAKPTVPPPVPALVVKAWSVPCDQCSKPGPVMYMQPGELEVRDLARKACKKCRGTGVLYIQDGRR